MDWEFKTDEIRATAQRFESASRNEVSGALHVMLRKIGRFLVPAMRREQPTAFGRLRQGTTFTIEGVRDLRLLILDGQRYGLFVREGTRPHWPPAAPINQWVVKKLGLRGKDASRATYFIRRKISRVGTKANPYHVRTLNRHRQDIMDAGRDAGVGLAVYLAGRK